MTFLFNFFARSNLDKSDFDLIHKDFNGKISKDDLIVFKEVGSYSIVMKPPFILPDVPIIEFDTKKKTFQIVRNKQTFQDIFSNFKFFN